MIERAAEQIVEIGVRMFRLDGGFEQLAAVACEQCRGVAPAQAFAPLADGNLAQRMQIAATSADEGDFSTKKKIQFAGELAFRPPRSLGDRFD